MPHSGPAAVMPTDQQWFDYFRREDEVAVWDEVNFWRPRSRARFQVVPEGGPVFFRLKAPERAIAGFGFFAAALDMTAQSAWQLFGEKNGDPTFERFASRLAGYRRSLAPRNDLPADRPLSCLILRDAVFLPRSKWLPWTVLEGWADSIVSVKGYRLEEGAGTVLGDLLDSVRKSAPPDLGDDFVLTEIDGSSRLYSDRVVREGQGAFRVRLLDAYGRRCSVTGEHSLPVLDAAHITPYRGPASNHVQNGLVLRADLHRLFDEGYVGVSPDLKFHVSSRLREDFDNGATYYQMEGRELLLPSHDSKRPSRLALEWHIDSVFR